ncbi:unnamed protein product [Echinostoma caproni]|uniref:Uncharacterized protein n=1 Tax=Echinostoma caproni TaxID=27848 RepID=A0A183B114_9TREM|nr:unnamed protein product [Echinostoma caproni]
MSLMNRPNPVCLETGAEMSEDRYSQQAAKEELCYIVYVQNEKRSDQLPGDRTGSMFVLFCLPDPLRSSRLPELTVPVNLPVIPNVLVFIR